MYQVGAGEEDNLIGDWPEIANTLLEQLQELLKNDNQYKLSRPEAGKIKSAVNKLKLEKKLK